MILIEDVHTLFDLWIDKTGSPYYTSTEKDFFIWRALIHYVTNHFNEQPAHMSERTIRDSEDLSELIRKFRS